MTAREHETDRTTAPGRDYSRARRPARPGIRRAPEALLDLQRRDRARPLNVMMSSPHEQAAYALEKRFAAAS